MSIEFVSYSGEYPCLCYGKLVVKIDGKETSFGSGFDLDADYPSFWGSGGSTGFVDQVDWEPVVTKGEWQLEACKKSYPEEIWKIMPDLLGVMNENVRHGCCGGCL